MRAIGAPRLRRGLTVVEIVVVLAIIGVLIGLLVPAVQMVRESAARTQCRNQLRQLALAAHAYDAQKGSLPPGYLGTLPVGSPNHNGRFQDAQWVGMLPFLLPFLGQDAIVRRLNVDWRLDAATQPWYDDAENLAVAQTRLKELICPADDPYSNDGSTVIALGFYASGPDSAVISVRYETDPEMSASLGRTSYVGVAGRMGHIGLTKYDRREGVFFNRSRVRLSDVSANDGTSCVLMIGESLGGSYPGPRDHAFSWLGTGVTSSALGIPSVGNHTSFSSHHSHVVHFALCDGSIRALQTDSNITSFLQWSAYHDGSVKE